MKVSTHSSKRLRNWLTQHHKRFNVRVDGPLNNVRVGSPFAGLAQNHHRRSSKLKIAWQATIIISKLFVNCMISASCINASGTIMVTGR